MKLTSKQIAELVGGQLNGPDNLMITGAAGLDEAQNGDVSFLANPKYASKIEASKAGLIILPDSHGQIIKPSVRVKNPQLAFTKILETLAPEINPAIQPAVHASASVSKKAVIGKYVYIGAHAVIEDGAAIGDGARIYPNVYIGRNSSIGRDTVIYPNATVREHVSIGERCIIHPGAVLGSDGFGFTPEGKKHRKIPQLGTVKIGDDVEIGANTTVDRATTGETRIGSGTKIDNLVQIAHNVHIGQNCILTAQVGIAGSTNIGDNVVFGGQSGSVGHVTIGNGAMIAGRSVCTRDVKDGEIVSGFPARPHREEMKIEALVQKLPEFYEKLKKIEEK